MENRRQDPPARQHRETTADVLFFSSARRHGVSRRDCLWVIEHAHVVLRLRDEPEKLLYLGFDAVGRPREIVTDTTADGRTVVIHADTMTPAYFDLL